MEGALFDGPGEGEENPYRVTCLRLANVATLNGLIGDAPEYECPSTITITSGQQLVCSSITERGPNGAPIFRFQCALQKVVCIQPAYMPGLEG